jgi:hypothetical protein
MLADAVGILTDAGGMLADADGMLTMQCWLNVD